MRRAFFDHLLTFWLVILASGLTVLAPRTAAGDDAEAMVKRGVDLRREGKDREALEEFRKAWEIDKAPRTEAQLALAEQALGLWVTAEEHLRGALQSKQDAWIKKNAATLSKALEVIAAHLGTLELWGSPAGATIFVNEKKVGTLPLATPLRIAGDSAVVRARADGYLELSRVIRVPPGDSVREHIELVPAPAGEPHRVAAAGAAADRTSAGRPPAEMTGPPSSETNPRVLGDPDKEAAKHDEPPRGSRRNLRPFAWVAAGAAAGGLAFGVFETVTAIHRSDDFNNHTAPNPDPSAPMGSTYMDCNTTNLSDACRPLQQKYNRAVTLAIVGYAAGVVLAAGSSALFLLSRRDDPGDTRSAFSCGPTLTARGVSCVLAF